MNVNYVIVEASVIGKSTNINLKFKRIPTKEELKDHTSDKQQYEKMMISMFPPSMQSMVSTGDDGPRLDFQYIDMVISLGEFNNSNDLNVGSVVEFNIPTSISDIVNIVSTDTMLV